MKQYKLAKGWAILIYIIGPLLIGLFGWLLLMPFIPNMNTDIDSTAYWILAPISIGMIALMILGIIDAAKGKFVINKDKVYTVGVFSTRQLYMNEIKGYRIDEKYIFIEPKERSKKRLKISTYFSHTGEIINWLTEYYPNLDFTEAESEKTELLKNEAFGWTTEQREEKLKQAKRVSLILNWVGGLSGVWILFYPTPYEYAVTLAIVLPWVGLVVIKIFRGLIHLDERKNSIYPSIIWLMFATSMTLMLRALLDYDIFDYSRVWIFSAMVLVSYLVILLIGNQEFNFNETKTYATLLSILMFLSAYSFGTVVTLNCMYDTSSQEPYHATVLNKRISSGKTTTYYIELTAWGPRKEIDEVSVSKQLFQQLEINDEVNVYFMQGKFLIPWFFVTKADE